MNLLIEGNTQQLQLLAPSAVPILPETLAEAAEKGGN
jgi:hypothetical protein